MAENTAIEWADHTFNPWVGCTKVSPGCDHCYAEARMDTRLHLVSWGPGQPRQRTKTWGSPKRWNGQHAEFFARHGRRQRVFCASLADVFDNEVPTEWRADLFQLIETTPNLDWLLLTKRIGNAKEMMFRARGGYLPLLPNVWIGATVVNQAEADRDIPKLLAVPARVRFLSIEPMLGAIDLTLDGLVCTACRWCADTGSDPDTGAVEHCRRCEWTGKGDEWGIDWVICGGESGPGARPIHPDWARSLRDQCAAAGVPFLFKQWGEWAPLRPSMTGRINYDGPTLVQEHCAKRRPKLVPGYEIPNAGEFPGWMFGMRVGKAAAGRLLDGSTHDGFPS